MMTSSWPVWSIDRVLAERPAVRVNQVGYHPGGPKRATLVMEAAEPTSFTVVGPDGSVVFAGVSQVWPERPEPTSGLGVHVLDFTAVGTDGTGFRVRAGEQQSHPFRLSAQLYDGLARDALRFFYLQRSGTAIDGLRAPGYGRPAGHVGREPNRGDTSVPAWDEPAASLLYPGWRAHGRFDVSGGWYDAGDFGKYLTSGSIAVWQLLNVLDLLRRHPHAPRPIPESGLIEEIRWQLDWMLRMQVPPGQPLEGMAFHRVHGTEWSPLPGWPHDDPTRRVLHRPSTGATLHLAAVAAQGARLLRAVDAAYADRLLQAARIAHGAAHRQPRLIAPDDHGVYGGGPYGDEELDDDYYWATVELWLATGDERFRRELEGSSLHHADAFSPDGFDFDQVAGPARLDLALTAGRAEREHVGDAVLAGAERLLELEQRQPWGQPYAPLPGWAWGSNGRILNNLVVLGTAAELTDDDRFRNGVLSGLDYLFGRNGLGQSYVTGYGTDYTAHQRTRHFARDLDPAFPAAPTGSVAGGANSRSHPGFPTDSRLAGLPPQLCYLDEPTSETTNDVCIRWNAPLVWIATYVEMWVATAAR